LGPGTLSTFPELNIIPSLNPIILSTVLNEPADLAVPLYCILLIVTSPPTNDFAKFSAVVSPTDVICHCCVDVAAAAVVMGAKEKVRSVIVERKDIAVLVLKLILIASLKFITSF
jgi:hypothetical protein